MKTADADYLLGLAEQDFQYFPKFSSVSWKGLIGIVQRLKGVFKKIVG
jgi:hypothetical protein